MTFWGVKGCLSEGDNISSKPASRDGMGNRELWCNCARKVEGQGIFVMKMEKRRGQLHVTRE